MPRSRRYLVITLAATYPDGEIGYVTGVLRYEGTSVIDRAVGIKGMVAGPRAPTDLIDAIESMETLYHTEIGPAYAQADFSFTIHDIDDIEELFSLMGRAMLDRNISGTRKPDIGSGISVL
jgi:hypothetical protein